MKFYISFTLLLFLPIYGSFEREILTSMRTRRVTVRMVRHCLRMAQESEEDFRSKMKDMENPPARALCEFQKVLVDVKRLEHVISKMSDGQEES